MAAGGSPFSKPVSCPLGRPALGQVAYSTPVAAIEPALPAAAGRASPRRLRLCSYLGSVWLGGMETNVARLLAGLPDHYDLTLIAESEEVASWVSARRPGMETVLLPPVRSKRDLGVFSVYVRTLRRLHPDVLHVNLGHLYVGKSLFAAAAVAGVPTVATVHGAFPQRPRAADAILRCAARQVAAFCGVSAFVCRRIEADLRVPARRIHLVYNGVPEQAPSCPARGEAQDGRCVLGAVGRLAPEKGYDVLLRALQALPGCELVLAGTGPAGGELRALAAAVGVADRVRFAGWLEEPWMAGFDVVVVPSRAEGFGLAAVEAMRAGIPVVASDVGGLREIADGDAPCLVPPENPRALAGALGPLVSDPARREQLGRAGREVVAGRFSVGEMLAAYERLFEAVRRR